jgi:CubicO group peptidase (beta-lactamase class C family)
MVRRKGGGGNSANPHSVLSAFQIDVRIVGSGTDNPLTRRYQILEAQPLAVLTRLKKMAPLKLAQIEVVFFQSVSRIRSERLNKGSSMRARFAAAISVAFLVPTCVLAHAQESAELQGQIKRVESGLLPMVAMKDRVGATHSIQERMAAYGVPGVGVAVVKDGKLLWARSYGVVETAVQKSVANDTLFLAGSISKPVAALGALTLVKNKKIGLDDDVNSRLKSWQVPDSPLASDEKVTLRRLLSHTAGLTVHGFPGYASTMPVPTLLQVLNGEKPANTAAILVDRKPGSLYRYSGGGYTVMQQLVIDLSGMPFESYLRSAVLSPLGMSHSTFAQTLSAEQVARRATGHRSGGKPIPGKVHVYPEMAAAGLWTTASDLAQYVVYVQNAAEGRDDQLLNSDLVRQMLSKQQGGGHGLGPQIEGEGEALRFVHGGVDEGFEANLIGYVQGGNGAVVMANSNLSGPLRNEIIASIAKEYQWPKFPTRAQMSAVPISKFLLERLPGRYQLGPVGPVAIVARGDKLIAQSEAYGELELFGKTEDSIFQPLIGIILGARAAVDENGRVTKMQMGNIEYKRLD